MPLVDDSTLDRRAELARRLKAARWLQGGVRKAETGRAGYEVYAVTAEELATRPGMAENQITASKIGSIERMERHTPPMEIAVIARALGMAEAWFTAPAADVASSPAFGQLQQLLVDLGLVPGTLPEEPRAASDDQGRQDRSAGTAGA